MAESQEALAVVVSSAGAEWRGVACRSTRVKSSETGALVSGLHCWGSCWHARRSTSQSSERKRRVRSTRQIASTRSRSGCVQGVASVPFASGLRRPSEHSWQGQNEKLGRGLAMPDMSNRVPFAGAVAATLVIWSKPLRAGSPRGRAADAPAEEVERLDAAEAAER